MTTKCIWRIVTCNFAILYLFHTIWITLIFAKLPCIKIALKHTQQLYDVSYFFIGRKENPDALHNVFGERPRTIFRK
jgi:hypothetical protein